MKIIKRTDQANLVVFAGPNITLEGQVVTGNGWSYIAPNSWIMVIEDAVLPEGYLASGWTYTAGVWTINATGANGVFPGKRRVKIEALEDASYGANYANITYNLIEWATDEISRDLLAQVLSAGSVPLNMYWRDAAKAPRNVTYAQLQGLAYAILERALAIDTNLVTKTAAVNAANTVAAINAVTW